MIREFIKFAIEKPILNHIFLLFLIVISIFAYFSIPKEIFPPSNLDIINVTGHYSGASSDTLDKMVVKSIEDDLKNLSDISQIDTVIKNGSFSIEAKLKSDSEPSDVLSDIKDVISSIKQDLPSDMNEPTAKVLKQAFPLLLIAIAGDDKERLLNIADELKSELSSIEDLSTIAIRGDSDIELLIELDEQKIDAYGIDKNLLINSISNLSSIFPIGEIKERGSHLYLSTINGEKDLDSLKKTILRVDSKRFYLNDIAKVSLKLGDSDQISSFNGIENISLDVQKSKNGNAIALSKEIKEILKTYENRYSNIEFKAYTDTSIWIKNRLNTVVSNILFGLILVFFAMYMFINSRIAIVVAIGIPTSFMIALIITNYLGYSLNMLSLLGALIALGMLVDEAIVVAENIYRHLEMGKDAKDAVIDGAVEMFPAVLTATATTIFAFLPLLILSGSLGVFLKILPVMISILLISSLFEAFYFLPMHSKDILRVRAKKSSKSIWVLFNKIYNAILGKLVKYQKTSLILILTLIFLSTFAMFKITKFQLFPEFDTTQLYVSGKVNVNNSLKDTKEIISELEKNLFNQLSKDAVSSITSVVGFKLDQKNRAEVGEYYFHIFVNLYERVPQDFYNEHINPYLSPEYDDSEMKREASAKDISKDIEKIVEPFREKLTNKREFLFEELNIVVPQTGVLKSDVEISLSGDMNLIKESINRLKEQMSKVDGVSNITDDFVEGVLELKLKVNQYGYDLGFNEREIERELKPFFLKGEYGKMFTQDGVTKIKFQSLSKDKIDILNRFSLNTPDRLKVVMLKDVVDFIYQPSFSKIIKEDGEKIQSVYASLDKKIITSAELLERLEPLLREISKDVKVIIKGEQKENENVQKEIAEAGVIAIFLIFISLVAMFNSIAKPLMILSTIPLTILGVLIGHFIMGVNLTLPSLIGVVGLAGVVVNDGLIMLDFLRKAESKERLLSQATLRLRPILLTSLTTIIGLSTLIFFPTGQSLILQPMAITLGFGLIWATVLNLYYLPILFSVVYRLKD